MVPVALSAPFQNAGPAPFDLSHYHGADGSYRYTYSAENESKTEARSSDGQVRGAYSYIDTNGILQKIQYQVYATNRQVGSTVPVKETPEVLEATAQQFALVDKHLKKLEVAKRLEEEYRAKHPERFQQTEETVPAAFPQQYVIHQEAPKPVAPSDEVIIRHEVPTIPQDVVPVHHVIIQFRSQE